MKLLVCWYTENTSYVYMWITSYIQHKIYQSQIVPCNSSKNMGSENDHKGHDQDDYITTI
jgi:hypothetical protein